jgi:5-formyltetrahydrofolate cyclo-ligase
MEKAEGRQIIRDRLSQMTAEDVAEKSSLIKGFVIDSEVFKGAESVFVYVSTAKEADTSGIISEAIRLGKKVYFPKIEADKMVMTLFSKNTNFSLTKFGFLQDNDSVGVIEPGDLVIAPLLAYDSKFNRLGKGKGFYDRFLAKNPSKVMALAFSNQYFDGFPTTEYDIKVDYIATERGILKEKI